MPVQSTRLAALLVGLVLLVPLATAATSLYNTITNGTANEQHAFANFDSPASAVGDFDRDGRPEIVSFNDNKWLYVLSTTQPRVLAEILTPYPSGWGARPINDPAIADVDGDGRLEIVAANSAGYVCVYEYSSGTSTTSMSFTRRWCDRMDTYGAVGADAGVAVEDVNGDGRMEIYSQVETRGLFAYNHDGSTRWTKDSYGGNAGPLLTDLEGDGRKEVVFFSDGGTVRAFDASSGSSKWTFHSNAYVSPASIPVAGNAADIDGDGKREVVYSARHAPEGDTNYDDNHLMIFVLSHTGSLQKRWQPSWGNPLSYTHPVLIDVNGDGTRDILMQDWNTIGHKPGNWERLGNANVFAYKHDGTFLWRTELDNSWSNDDLAVADVDGDGSWEVLAIGRSGADGVWYLDLRTGAKEGHVSVGSDWLALRGPIAGNLLGDGRLSWAISIDRTGSSEGGWKVFRTDAPCRVAFAGWQNEFGCGGGSTPPPPPPDDGGTGGSAGSVTFTHGGGNEWWVEVKVGPTPSSVQAMDTGGSWVTLELKSWGEWAGSFHIEPGHLVKFRALHGSTWTESCWYTHPGGSCSGSSTPPPTSGSFSATFKNVRGNEWWVETDVSTSGGTLSGVDARVNGGSWIALEKQDWGSWAKSFHAEGTVEFRARSTDGQQVVSGKYSWPPS